MAQGKAKWNQKTTQKSSLLQNTVHQQLYYIICTNNEIKRVKQLKLRITGDNLFKFTRKIYFCMKKLHT